MSINNQGAAPDGGWTARAHTAMSAAGHRQGGARSAVIAAMARAECCRTAAELADEASSGTRAVGIASVYRIAERLRVLGLVRRLDLGDGTVRFEPVREPHHHLVCLTCGRVMPFTDRGLERALRDSMARAPGADEAEVVLRGRCPECLAA